MKYFSTRGLSPAASFSDVMLGGLAPDGGLYMPENNSPLTIDDIDSLRNLSYEELIKRFETDLKWNYMIFQIYKNKISLNTAEIENKLQLRLENLESPNDQKINLIKEQIVNSEKEKKLNMFSNMHFSNLERLIQINFL